MLTQDALSKALRLFEELKALYPDRADYHASQVYLHDGKRAYTLFIADRYIITVEHTHVSDGQSFHRSPVPDIRHIANPEFVKTTGDCYVVKDRENELHSFKDMCLGITPALCTLLVKDSEKLPYGASATDKVIISYGTDQYVLTGETKEYLTGGTAVASWRRYSENLGEAILSNNSRYDSIFLKCFQSTESITHSLHIVESWPVISLHSGRITLTYRGNSIRCLKPEDEVLFKTASKEYKIAGIHETTYDNIYERTLNMSAETVFKKLGNLETLKAGLKLTDPVKKADEAVTEMAAPAQAPQKAVTAPLPAQKPSHVETALKEAEVDYAGQYDKDAEEAAKFENEAQQPPPAPVVHPAKENAAVAKEVEPVQVPQPQPEPETVTQSDVRTAAAEEPAKEESKPEEPTLDTVSAILDGITENTKNLAKDMAALARINRAVKKSVGKELVEARKSSDMAAELKQWRDRAITAEDRLRKYEDLQKILAALK